jgi:hypothetical protein
VNINDLTLGQIKEIHAMTNGVAPVSAHAYEIGAPYLIRCVTFYYTGRLVAVHANELVLDTAAWIPDTGRYHECVKSGTVKECEPIVGQLIIGRGSIVDATRWPSNVPLPVQAK